MANNNITEEFQLNLSLEKVSDTFQLSDIAYDIALADIPFVIRADTQNFYNRTTAQYKRDQVDVSTEPGEQSMVGWWLRSQTSWHNGSGIKFYEPGTDAAHTTHRYNVSRGVDVWTMGEASLHYDLFHAFTGSNGIVATEFNDGITDCLISGDSAGTLRKVIFNGDTNVTGVTGHDVPITVMSTGLTSHNGSYKFLSVTSDGSRYFAVCNRAIHRGTMSVSSGVSTTTDAVIYHLGATAVNDAIIHYAKGYLLFGSGQYLYKLDPDKTTASQHSSTADLPSATNDFVKNLSPNWKWTSIAGGGTYIYAAGRDNHKSEIWAIPYDEAITSINLAQAHVAAELPAGEFVNTIYQYLGYVIIGTNKGIRIAVINQAGYQQGNIVYGPLLFLSDYDVTDITAQDRYVWCATSAKDEDNTINAVLIRIDLSTPFEDGTFPWAYDLEYLSDDPSYGVGVKQIEGKLHLIVNEGTSAGEIQRQHSTNKRPSGYLKTGYIRYATSQPKYFKYLDLQSNIPVSSSVSIKSIDANSTEYDIISLSSTSSSTGIELSYPSGKQEAIALKITLNASTDLLSSPRLDSYQIRSIPGVTRQRMIQYPLSCFDVEMDRFNSQFGYIGRSFDIIQKLETLENDGNFIEVNDYRTNERYTGIIEEVRFVGEASSDKNNSGYGGTLIVTVRKM